MAQDPSRRDFIANALTHPEVGYYDGGLLTWLTGNNTGLNMEVKTFDPETNVMTLFLPMPYDIVIGDTFSVYPGCDKSLTTCKIKFNNVVNFRGEPFVPGQDALFNYPNSKA